MAVITSGTWPNKKNERITSANGSDLRQLTIQFNTLLTNLATLFNKLTGDVVIVPSTLSRGTTVTMTRGACSIAINGAVANLAADSNKAISATGNTIKAGKWGLIAVEVVAAGTTTFVGAAGNATGYNTEALAIAALPAQTADKVQVGYITVKADAGGDWVANTDALAGGTGGTPATTTNYYSTASVYDDAAFTASQIATQDGTVLTSSNY